MPDNQIAALEKYPIVKPHVMANAETATSIYVGTFCITVFVWLAYSNFAGYKYVEQLALLGAAFFFVVIKRLLTDPLSRSELDLKAKGLDIKDKYMNALMPWDWLKQVEIRQRSFNFFPNYVYFKFQDNSDVLLLWDDIKNHMDSTTLISCVRTWAPNAEIKGDATLTKSESIATYTELWLKDMSSIKTERRTRADQTLAIGTELSDSYKVEKVLSGGGQGTAYYASLLPTAEVPNVPPHIVLKELILPANERGLKKATDGLIKEVIILRRINHPRIVRLYDFFIEDMRGYLAVEFIDGKTLRQAVADTGVFDDAKAAKVARELCDALSYLHKLSPSVIHGDVTPDNVMIEKNGDVKLLDFDASQELTKNKTNTVVGKHAYMSPEQFRGDLLESSDIYSLGCTLNYLLTGQDPEPMSESKPKEQNNSVSTGMNILVATATKFEASNRFTTIEEMRRQLEQF